MKRALIAFAVAIVSMGMPVMAKNPFSMKPKANAYMASDALVKDMTQMENDWDAALVSGDMAKLQAIMAPEYVYIDGNGVTDRETSLKQTSSREYVPTAMMDKNLDVRTYHGVVLVRGRLSEKSTYKGKDTSGDSMFTDIYVKNGKTWQCVLTQETSVAQ